MEVLAAFEMGLGQAVDGQFHGINRIAAAGEYGHFHQLVEGLIQGLPTGPPGTIGPAGELGYGHAVFGEGAGFIHGQNRGAAQAFHRRGPAGQHPKAGEPEGPKGQKQGQHHGDFVGQHGQGQGQGC